MREPINVLLVEDSPDDAFLVERALAESGLAVRTRRVETLSQLNDALSERWDVVLADYSLPTLDARVALETLQASGRDVPFIVVTGTIGEERAAELLRAGADDFLLKDSLARLGRAVARAIGEAAVRREREEARAEVDRARERYEALVAHATDVIYVLDAEGWVRFTSPGCEPLIGLAPSEVLGEDAFAFVHADDVERVRAGFERVVEDGGRAVAQYRIVRPDGEIRHVESVATDLMDHHAVGGVVLNTRDVTERKELEEQLLQSQKMEAVGRLAGGVAHDFNNLLTVISGNTRILLEQLPEDSAHREDAEQVLKASTQVSDLTRQLLAFSRNQVTNPRVVEVCKVVEGVREMLQRLMGEDIELAVSACDHGAFARIDPVQIEQIVMNLAVNAREAMPTGGHVSIAVDTLPASELSQDAEPVDSDRYVRLVFRDSGPGIPPEHRGRIFEPFFSTKEMGTGLGLSTIYGIVTQNGGHIRVECPPSGGTTFVVALPETAEAGEEDTRSSTEDGPGEVHRSRVGGERILLVEDSADVRRVASRILSREGFEVEAAASGNEALERVRANGHLDLVLTDLVMPGMSGSEFARKLRGLRPGVPVLYMSGYSGDAAPEPQDLAVRSAFLAKPFTPQELTRSIRRLLDERYGA